jgi:hypothetical protein
MGIGDQKAFAKKRPEKAKESVFGDPKRKSQKKKRLNIKRIK